MTRSEAELARIITATIIYTQVRQQPIDVGQYGVQFSTIHHATAGLTSRYTRCVHGAMVVENVAAVIAAVA